MIKRIIKSHAAYSVLRSLFGVFYEKSYLEGYYYQEKVMGWYWALRGLRSHVFGENRKVPWPVHPRTIVSGSENISFPQDSLNVFAVPGCYWQAFDGKISIGSDCHIAPNVGIVTTNHDSMHPSEHVAGKDITIGNNCWVGMNAVILPGVVLGDHTVVAAGAVVAKSFPQGYCIIGGVPAKKISDLKE